jgi:hypothetical protein
MLLMAVVHITTSDEVINMLKRPPSPCTKGCKGRTATCALTCPRYKIYRIMRERFYVEQGILREQEQQAIEYDRAQKKKRKK